MFNWFLSQFDVKVQSSLPDAVDTAFPLMGEMIPIRLSNISKGLMHDPSVSYADGKIHVTSIPVEAMKVDVDFMGVDVTMDVRVKHLVTSVPFTLSCDDFQSSNIPPNAEVEVLIDFDFVRTAGPSIVNMIDTNFKVEIRDRLIREVQSSVRGAVRALTMQAPSAISHSDS
jgi:hypothetical protein